MIFLDGQDPAATYCIKQPASAQLRRADAIMCHSPCGKPGRKTPRKIHEQRTDTCSDAHTLNSSTESCRNVPPCARMPPRQHDAGMHPRRVPGCALTCTTLGCASSVLSCASRNDALSGSTVSDGMNLTATYAPCQMPVSHQVSHQAKHHGMNLTATYAPCQMPASHQAKHDGMNLTATYAPCQMPASHQAKRDGMSWTSTHPLPGYMPAGS